MFELLPSELLILITKLSGTNITLGILNMVSKNINKKSYKLIKVDKKYSLFNIAVIEKNFEMIKILTNWGFNSDSDTEHCSVISGDQFYFKDINNSMVIKCNKTCDIIIQKQSKLHIETLKFTRKQKKYMMKQLIKNDDELLLNCYLFKHFSTNNYYVTIPSSYFFYAVKFNSIKSLNILIKYTDSFPHKLPEYIALKGSINLYKTFFEYYLCFSDRYINIVSNTIKNTEINILDRLNLIFKNLFTNIADLEILKKNGWKSICVAIRYNNLEALKFLINKRKILENEKAVFLNVSSINECYDFLLTLP